MILWSGETGRKLVQLATDHAGNIFSVKFLPDSGDRALVTGAQDARVCLIDVPRETVLQSAAFHFGRVSLPASGSSSYCLIGIPILFTSVSVRDPGFFADPADCKNRIRLDPLFFFNILKRTNKNLYKSLKKVSISILGCGRPVQKRRVL